MTFEFFNTSNLAFGSKLTSAFKTLDDMAQRSVNNVNVLLSDLEFYEQYLDRNYRVPAPTKGTMAARTNELFNLLDEKVEVQYVDYSDNLFSFACSWCDKNTKKITVASGTTNIKKGYAYVMPATTNVRMNRTIRFSDVADKKNNEIKLFQYRINSKGKVFLVGSVVETLDLFPQEFNQYTSLSRGSTITLPYTASDYECIAIRAYYHSHGDEDVLKDLKVVVNGNVIMNAKDTFPHHNGYRHCIVYLKPNDRLTGTYGVAFKVDYNY